MSERLVCPPDVLASLSDFYGDAWQPSARTPSRGSDGHLLQYGTLLVPVATANRALGETLPDFIPEVSGPLG